MRIWGEEEGVREPASRTRMRAVGGRDWERREAMRQEEEPAPMRRMS